MADTSEKRPDAMLMRMSHVTHYKVLPILRLEDLNGQHCFTTCMDFSSNLEEIFHHHRIRSIGRKLYSKFKSIGRIHLFRFSHPNQAKSWLMILDFPIFFFMLWVIFFLYKLGKVITNFESIYQKGIYCWPMNRKIDNTSAPNKKIQWILFPLFEWSKLRLKWT